MRLSKLPWATSPDTRCARHAETFSVVVLFFRACVERDPGGMISPSLHSTQALTGVVSPRLEGTGLMCCVSVAIWDQAL